MADLNIQREEGIRAFEIESVDHLEPLVMIRGVDHGTDKEGLAINAWKVCLASAKLLEEDLTRLDDVVDVFRVLGKLANVAVARRQTQGVVGPLPKVSHTFVVPSIHAVQSAPAPKSVQKAREGLPSKVVEQDCGDAEASQKGVAAARVYSPVCKRVHPGVNDVALRNPEKQDRIGGIQTLPTVLCVNQPLVSEVYASLQRASDELTRLAHARHVGDHEGGLCQPVVCLVEVVERVDGSSCLEQDLCKQPGLVGPRPSKTASEPIWDARPESHAEHAVAARAAEQDAEVEGRGDEDLPPHVLHKRQVVMVHVDARRAPLAEMLLPLNVSLCRAPAPPRGEARVVLGMHFVGSGRRRGGKAWPPSVGCGRRLPSAGPVCEGCPPIGIRPERQDEEAAHADPCQDPALLEHLGGAPGDDADEVEGRHALQETVVAGKVEG
mmetsp:Transcript_16526/g.32611  ORF Transcript_16526/g.32611 Transcript_16526/m.32611 type:complete len:438 (-) Transcript_16526:221-1534(-)